MYKFYCICEKLILNSLDEEISFIALQLFQTVICRTRSDAASAPFTSERSATSDDNDIVGGVGVVIRSNHRRFIISGGEDVSDSL